MMKVDLIKGVEALVKIDDEIDVLQNDCEIIEFLLDNCEFELSPKNRFFVRVNCENTNKSKDIRLKSFEGIIEKSGFSEGCAALAYTGDVDFGHTCAGWESVISLGIYGLRQRVFGYAQNNSDTEHKRRFYQNLLRVYDAALRFMKRVAETAAICGKREISEGLFHLCGHRPTNLFEAMQTSFIYYNYLL